MTVNRSVPALRVRWLLHALSRNRLVRTSDRLEALAVLMVLAVALLVIPVAQREGDEAYADRMQLISAQQQSRHSVVAVATADSSSPAPRRLGADASVRVEWLEGSHRRSEVVTNPSFVAAKTPVTVWLDDAGAVVSAPDREVDAQADAAGRAWAVWVGIVGLCALLAFGFRRYLDHVRAACWHREFRLLAHNDDGWASHDL
ncbi:hypothetical protein GCM10023114_47630 [Mycolicibacterium sediminis]|uniref:Transmembrane protein n=1 Tax=Mycolicibacterium sediminis TaxID=1286180 RepID=A0A7I7QMH7_9MYCO|nr:hypothetical protein MSEDJ_15800 [Mycolicibacterium sediminis]